jgi:tetratricopeptide (TPR) repeat protein
VRVWRHVPRFTIGNVNSSDNEITDEARTTTYLVISGGGKWGYDTAFDDFLAQIAPCLEDATFFLGDEYSQQVVMYAFTDGVLAIDYLANNEQLETFAEPMLGTPALRAAYARQRLAMWLHLREPAGGMALVDELLAIEPHAWEAHVARAKLLAAGEDHVAALASLDTAYACLGPITIEREHGGARIAIDPEYTIAPAVQQIELERAARYAALERSDDALAAYDRAFEIGPRASAAMLGKATELAKHDRFAEADVALALALQRAQTRDEIWPVYYARARVAARAGNASRALAALAIAYELGASKWQIAHEADFAGLRDLTEMRRILA